jgi:hypothetical protein
LYGSNPIPLIPFPLSRGRGTILYKRGASPSLTPHWFNLLAKGKGKILIEEGEALLNTL